ncbi:DNA/RNA nuclease SfsA [bacterium]|nr:DNA/RNA nuclease SfsA [bacterium]
MKLPQPLQRGRLLRRYKRFLADILMDDGREITAVTPNTGSMKGLCVTNAPVMVSYSNSPSRKIPYTWELVEIQGKWVGINTHLPNALVAECLDKRSIPELAEFETYRREVRLQSGSRIDFGLGNDEALLEVKNVTLVENSVALFPDSITERGTKHLHELMGAVSRGVKAYMVYVVQHHLAESFSPADGIDPVYGKALRAAENRGVKLLALKAKVSEFEISLTEQIPIHL